MTVDPHNRQYGADAPFGMSAGIAETGAPGTAGTSPAATAGPVVGSPVITTPFASSQVPGNTPAVDVHSGDTSAFSDDTPVHSSPLLPGDPAPFMATGAGTGRVHAPRPGRPS